MNPREIRAMLRGATKAGRIIGWYGGTETLPDLFYWHPGDPGMKSQAQAEGFVIRLFAEGIDPLYTAAEPGP